MMGVGYLGEVRQGPDGNLYQWMQGVDGLGNAIGFWGKLRRLARKALTERCMQNLCFDGEPGLSKTRSNQAWLATQALDGETKFTPKVLEVPTT